MAYDLFFRQQATCSEDRWQGPALGLTMPRDEWESVVHTIPDAAATITEYLGRTVPWKITTTSLGYNGCAIIDKRKYFVEIILPYHSRNIRNSMLTLSFLLRDIYRSQDSSGRENDHLQLQVGCHVQQPTIFGCASEEFKKGLARVPPDDLEMIEDDMYKAWRATAMKGLKRYANDCYARVRDDRFELGCFGDACDLSIYPDSNPFFSCHNLGTAFQQATLLAGLASLYSFVKSWHM